MLGSETAGAVSLWRLMSLFFTVLSLDITGTLDNAGPRPGDLTQGNGLRPRTVCGGLF